MVTVNQDGDPRNCHHVISTSSRSGDVGVLQMIGRRARRGNKDENVDRLVDVRVIVMMQ